MSFNISLSGVNAAASDLAVTSNNIANVGTIGFKGSRAEFADIYAVSALGSSDTTVGSGVFLSTVSQQFSQGNLEFTENNLDLAIRGEGFFVLNANETNREPIYTRAGAFQVNSEGRIVNSSGQLLQGFPVDADTGTPTSTSLSSTQSIQIPKTAGDPRATSRVDMSVNLPANQTPPAAYTLDANNAIAPQAPRTTISEEVDAVFDPADTATYDHSTSVTVYDSLGNSYIASLYYIRTDPVNNAWETRIDVDISGSTQRLATTVSGDSQGLAFDSTGRLASPVNGEIRYDPVSIAGADPLTLTIDYGDLGANPTVASATQFNQLFTVTSLSQDGYTTGRLSGLEITDEGIVRANYSNGQGTALAKLAMAQFDNPQGLRQLGNTTWAETISSGSALAGEAGSGTFGLVQSGAVESANVDLTNQLVKLITAQRNFQANSKAIETANTVTQTIINIR